MKCGMCGTDHPNPALTVHDYCSVAAEHHANLIEPAVANCPDCGWDFLPDEPQDCPACKIGVGP